MSRATPWTVSHQVPLSTEFYRQENWSGLPFPTSGDLPHPRTEPTSLASPAWQADSLPLVTPGKALTAKMAFPAEVPGHSDFVF